MIDVGPTLTRELQDQKIAIAFLALHGAGGEDGSMQGFLETLGVPYTGSGVQASAVGMHKVTTKTILAAHGIPVPAGFVIKRGQRISRVQALRSGNLRWPVVVKPASEGSTIGVTIVKKPAQWNDALAMAHRYDRDAMVEAYVPGHEVTVSLLGRKDEAPLALPAVEIVAPDGFYDFSAKYEKGKTRYLCPAPLPPAITKHIRNLALRTFDILDCAGAVRVDFRITPRGRPYVLEINTVPGMTETSLLPMAAAQAGIGYEELTERILESAIERMSQTGHAA
jgi:D-alanine-D-alanine ligase